MTRDKWAIDRRTPTDWGNIARLREMETSQTLEAVEEALEEEKEPRIPRPQVTPPDQNEIPLQSGQFDLYTYPEDSDQTNGQNPPSNAYEYSHSNMPEY